MGRPPGGAVDPLVGARVDCIRDIYFERNMGAGNYIFLYALCLFEIFCLSLTVPVLALNYKHHILSPAEVRKVCYSVAELCQICLFEFISGRGRDFY
jgi:hypothetical protein